MAKKHTNKQKLLAPQFPTETHRISLGGELLIITSSFKFERLNSWSVQPRGQGLPSSIQSSLTLKDLSGQEYWVLNYPHPSSFIKQRSAKKTRRYALPKVYGYHDVGLTPLSLAPSSRAVT